MTDKIYAMGMSPVATSHALVACGTSDPRVRLCDPASGNVTHAFAGHRDAVWAVEWTRGCEWILATGGCDGDIRLWDIRRAGAFMVLDASNARDAALDPLAQAVTHARTSRSSRAPPRPPEETWTPSRITSSPTPPCGVEAAATARDHVPPGRTAEERTATGRTRPAAAARAAADGAPGSEDDPAAAAAGRASPFDRTRRGRERTTAA